MSRAGGLLRVNGAIHEAGQLRISFTQFGKSYPGLASFTEHPSTTQYGKFPLCTHHQSQDQILVSKSALLNERNTTTPAITKTQGQKVGVGGCGLQNDTVTLS